MFDRRFEPALVDRYPSYNRAQLLMPGGIELFCAPRGMKVRRFHPDDVPLPHFSSIRLTEENGEFSSTYSTVTCVVRWTCSTCTCHVRVELLPTRSHT